MWDFSSQGYDGWYDKPARRLAARGTGQSDAGNSTRPQDTCSFQEGRVEEAT